MREATAGNDYSHGQQIDGVPMGPGAALKLLATRLTQKREELQLDRKVVDNTGLQGAYDSELHFKVSMLRSPTAASNSGNQEVESEGSQGTSDPSLFTAITEQLGLRLVPTKGAVNVFIIDHAEKPSENYGSIV